MRVKGPEPVLWRLSRFESVGRAVVKVRERRERKIVESILMADGSCSDLCRMCGFKDLGAWMDVGLVAEILLCWCIEWRLGSSVVLLSWKELAS